MPRSLGLFLLTFYATGMILGAGIYSVIGKAAGVAGEGLWLSFLLAALAAALTAFSYAELATLYPQAGAEYVYLKNIFPKYDAYAFVCGSMMIFAAVSTAATVALSFAGYLREFISVPEFGASVGVLLLLTLVNIRGVKESAWMNVLFTLLEIAGLILFVWAGAQSPSFGEALSTPLTWAVLPGATLIFFAYLGFENMVNLSEEAKDPDRNIPRAILLSLLLTTALYVLVSLAALALKTPQELAAASAVLSQAVAGEFPSLAGALAGLALFATANTAMIAMLAGSRIVLGMSRGRDLPDVLSKILPTRQTPWMASMCVLVISVLFLFLGRIEIVASVSSFVTIFVFIVINVTVIYLRKTDPDRKRSFRTPGAVAGWPVLPVLGILISIFFLFHFERQVYAVGGGLLLLTFLIYGLRRRWGPRR